MEAKGTKKPKRKITSSFHNTTNERTDKKRATARQDEQNIQANQFLTRRN
jgi:hypothetical protein